MKKSAMPDLPQECGFMLAPSGDFVCGQGLIYYVTQAKHRAALAAYCMAVIKQVHEHYANCDHGDFEEYNFWVLNVRAYLCAWHTAWSRYGGFSK